MSDKVYGGTPLSGDSICKTCQHGIHPQGYNFHEGIHCGYMGRLVHFSVRQCSKYTNAATTDLVEMRKIAWIVESRNRGTWGFEAGTDEPTEIVVRPPRPEEHATPSSI